MVCCVFLSINTFCLLAAVCCLSPAIFWLLSAAYHLLNSDYCLSLIPCCLPAIACCLSPAVFWLLSAASHLLSWDYCLLLLSCCFHTTVCCLSPAAVCWLLSAAFYLLSSGYCPLLITCCLLNTVFCLSPIDSWLLSAACHLLSLTAACCWQGSLLTIASYWWPVAFWPTPVAYHQVFCRLLHVLARPSRISASLVDFPLLRYYGRRPAQKYFKSQVVVYPMLYKLPAFNNVRWIVAIVTYNVSFDHSIKQIIFKQRETTICL